MRSRAVSLPASCCFLSRVLAAAELGAALEIFEMLDRIHLIPDPAT